MEHQSKEDGFLSHLSFVIHETDKGKAVAITDTNKWLKMWRKHIILKFNNENLHTAVSSAELRQLALFCHDLCVIDEMFETVPLFFPIRKMSDSYVFILPKILYLYTGTARSFKYQENEIKLLKAGEMAQKRIERFLLMS